MAQRPRRKLQPVPTDQHDMVDNSREASTRWSKSMDANVLRIARLGGTRGPGVLRTWGSNIRTCCYDKRGEVTKWHSSIIGC